MKTLKLFSILLLGISLATTSFAETSKTEKIKVSGECGMCKKKIETAAKTAGASFAEWNKDTKVLTVKYSTNSTNAAKIQEAIAGKGYDTPAVKATEEAYNSLDDCCKYERETGINAGEKTSKSEASCAGMDCCKKDGSAKMDCCKDGKCTKEGHKGKDCCKQ